MPTNIQANQFDPIMSAERRTQKDKERQQKEAELAKRSQPVEVWCTCGKCTSLDRAIENVCCCEDNYVQELLQNTNLNCITAHEGFEPTALNVYVLDAARTRLLYQVKDAEKRKKLTSDSNETYRFLAYSNFRYWLCSGKLGKGHRVVTPACVVKKIREKWPSPDGKYTGFLSHFNEIDDL